MLAGLDFGEALKTLMAAQDISVERMENESGISVSTLNDMSPVFWTLDEK